MTASRTAVTAILAFAGIATLIQPARSGEGAVLRRHTYLTKSEPANGDTLAVAPRTVRLWFSEAVELAVTNVKLSDAGGAAIAVAPLARPDTGLNAPIVASVAAPLLAGAYVVAWSTAAKDGHPAKGTIAFVIRATR